MSNVSDWRWRIAQAAEIRWWQRYFQGKDKANYLTWKRSYWRELLATIDVHPEQHAQVLDAGCGPAGIFTVLEQCNVIAVDPLLDRYDELEFFERSDYPYVNFVVSRLEDVQYQETIDYLFCLNVVNHVQDLTGTLSNLYAMCRPGATAIISVDGHRHGWLKPIFRAIPGDILHPHQYDKNEYVDLLVATGFEVTGSYLYSKEFLFDYWVLVCHRPEH